MPVAVAVPFRQSTRPDSRMPPWKTASNPVPNAPTAAPSVGVNQPR